MKYKKKSFKKKYYKRKIFGIRKLAYRINRFKRKQFYNKQKNRVFKKFKEINTLKLKHVYQYIPAPSPEPGSSDIRDGLILADIYPSLSAQDINTIDHVNS